MFPATNSPARYHFLNMANKKKRIKLKSLSQGRPPTVKPARSVSSKATRNVIRTYHTLEKERAKALAAGDDAKAVALAKEIELQGGIEGYQRASLIGQTKERGGDSSRVLMEWLEPTIPALKELSAEGKLGKPIRMLEVGALSVSNACSKSRLFDIERIDLSSQGEGITEQDFMERPLPQDGMEQFDIISLSLVLNYVPDPVGRGRMLLQTLKFLTARRYAGQLGDFFPSLFLVLPAPCVTNSRYLDETRLEAIMESMGYVNVRKKLSNKLVCYLWRLEASLAKKTLNFKKQEIRSGKSRNNFAIVLR
jgi:25S rRNA (adenine2142-N1)-methyltransferase